MPDITTVSQGGGPMGILGGLLGGAQFAQPQSSGLLGQGWNDPKSMANLALAAGLIRGDFGGGLLGAGQAFQGMQDAQLNRLDKQQQIAMRNLEAQMAMRKLSILNDVFGAGASGSQSQDSAPQTPSLPQSSMPPIPGGSLGTGTFGISVPTQPPVTNAPASQRNSIIASLTPDKLAALKTAGYDMTDIYKLATDPISLAPGSVNVNRFTGATTTVPSLSQDGKASQLVPDPTAPGGFRVIAPAGAVDTYSNYIDAQKKAENNNTLLPLTYVSAGPNGRPLGITVGEYLDGRRGAQQPQQAPQGLANQGGGTLTPDLQAAILADAQKNGGPAPTVNLTAPAGIKSPVFGLQGALPPSVVRVQPGANQGSGGASGGLQSAAEAEAAKAQALADVERNMKPGTTSANDVAAGDAANFKDYQAQLNKNVESGYQQYRRNQQIRQLMTEYQTGLSAPDARSSFASNLQNAFPGNPLAKAFAEKVNAGNVGSGQELAQILSSAGLTNVIKTLDGNGRVNKAEYQALQEHAESNRSDPSAMEGIMAFQDDLYKRQLAEQQAVAAAKKSGTLNPGTWEADYAQLRHDAQTPGSLPPTPGQVGAGLTPRAAIALPPNPSAANLVKNQTYTLPNGHTATWDGMKFKGQ